jgi:hypothetical protein
LPEQQSSLSANAQELTRLQDINGRQHITHETHKITNACTVAVEHDQANATAI